MPTLIIVSVALAIQTIVSLLNMSKSASLWLIIGQYQLLTILPVLGAYMPADVVTYCAGLKIFLFSGNIGEPADAYTYMDSACTDAYLTQIGFDSVSTFVNTYTLQLTLLATLAAHAIVVVGS